MGMRGYPITGSADYYLRHLAELYVKYLGVAGHGVWAGEALRHFGLTAGERIDRRALIQLMAGNYPDGRPAVQKQRWKSRKRQSGTDCVYTVPKSVSVIYAASRTRKQELSRILLECVVQSLRDIEWKVAWARRGHGGRRLERCKLLWAVVPHDETRPPGPGLLPEPALHWHCLNPNVCARLDGTTGAGFSHPLYETQRLASVLFDLRTSYALSTQLGLKVVPDGFSYRVEGVPDPLVSFWSSRSKQIRDRLAEVGDFTPRAAAKAARVRFRKADITPDERHARWLETARSFTFDPEVLFDPARHSRSPLSEKTQALAADMVVFDAADALNFRQPRFTEELLTIEAGVRCFGRRVSVEALLAAVERAVTRPLEHGLAPDGEKDGVPLFKRWDPPEPPAATRLPGRDAPSPEPRARDPGQPAGPPAPPPAVPTAPNGPPRKPTTPAPQLAPRPAGGPPVPRSPANAPPPGVPPQTPRGPSPFGQPASGPAPPAGRNQSVRARLGKLDLLLAPVRAWFAVRAAAKALIATEGHFTPSELKAAAWGPDRTLGVPEEALDRAVARVVANPGLYGHVRVGERAVNRAIPARLRGQAVGKEPVLTSRGQLKLERRLVRDAEKLFRSKGFRVKGRHLGVAAGMARGFGAERAVELLLGKSRLGLLNAEPGEERTVLLRAVANAAERSGGRVRLLAPTGGAAAAFGAELGGQASTASAFLAHATPTPALEVLGERLRKPSDPIQRRDVVIVTDAHALGTRELARLLRAVRRAKARLILAGTDLGKDSPAAGGGWRFLAKRLPTADLGSPDARNDSPERVAADLVRCGSPGKAVDALLADGRITPAEDNFGAFRALLDFYRVNGGLSDPARHMAVAGTRKDAAKLNRRIQAERNRAGKLGVSSVKVADGSRVRVGDLVAFSRPSKRLGVRTGERGRVTWADPLTGTVRVRTDSGRAVTVPVAEFPHLELAYAVTAFRAAGVQAAHWYAYVRGPAGSGFDRAGILSVLDNATEHAQLFTPLDRDALERVLGRANEKSLAVSHGAGGVKPLAQGVGQQPVLSPSP